MGWISLILLISGLTDYDVDPTIAAMKFIAGGLFAIAGTLSSKEG